MVERVRFQRSDRSDLSAMLRDANGKVAGSAVKVSIDGLLSAFKASNILAVQRLLFEGVGNKDVYNVTSPFKINGQEYIAGRVESRESETDSQVMFFSKSGEGEKTITYTVAKNAPVFDMQDPFFSIINGEFVFGGVELFAKSGAIGYKTAFYKGDDLSKLRKFAEGPEGMKDIRLVQLQNGKIGIFTRPQGEVGGRGRIGFMAIDSLSDLPKLTTQQYLSAPLLDLQVPSREWMGANVIHVLEDGKLMVLAHIARLSNRLAKNYYPLTFKFDSDTGKVSDMQMTFRREDLPPGPSKSKNLEHVLFPSGLVRRGDRTADIYLGAGDDESYRVTFKGLF